MPSRIVPYERGSVPQHPPAPGTLDEVVAIDDIEQVENHLIGECV